MRGRMPARLCASALAIGATLLAAARAEEAKPAQAPAASPETAVEEIYVLRSVREHRSQPPTGRCATARTKLDEPAWEDHYTFRSLATRTDDGRVVDTAVKRVGTIDACFGRTADAAVFQLYGDLDVNGTTGKAFGKCTGTRNDFPETGLKLFGCNFELFDLSGGYIGGQLTTNSMSSNELFGTRSTPEGYTQVSVATIRLWRKRPGS